MGLRTVCSLGVAFALAACGSPAQAPAPKAATAVPKPPAAAPVTAAVPAIADPKGTIDAVRSTAGAASAVTTARTQAVDGNKPGAPAVVASPGAMAAEAAPVLVPTAAKYDAQGRRDPFESLDTRAGSDRSTVASARLTGVVQSTPTAFALVETADGIGYILKPGDTLAEGRLVEIGRNMVVFSIAPKPGAKSNRVVLKLPE
jgi:hypothetical protein